MATEGQFMTNDGQCWPIMANVGMVLDFIYDVMTSLLLIEIQEFDVTNSSLSKFFGAAWRKWKTFQEQNKTRRRQKLQNFKNKKKIWQKTKN